MCPGPPYINIIVANATIGVTLGMRLEDNESICRSLSVYR